MHMQYGAPGAYGAALPIIREDRQVEFVAASTIIFAATYYVFLGQGKKGAVVGGVVGVLYALFGHYLAGKT